MDKLLTQLSEKSDKLEQIFTHMLSIDSSFTGNDIYELAYDINDCKILKKALYVTTFFSNSKKENPSSVELLKLVMEIDAKDKGKKLNKRK